MFAIRVRFPAGKCFAARADDPAAPEWPPHPSRLFSALVASAYRAGGGMDEAKREALQYLESLPPPSIWAPDADLTPAPRSYVPPGDAVERKGKKGEERFEHPVHRWRQDRHFPSAVILGEPFVDYSWHADPPQPIAEALARIALDVTHVGTSHSMAQVSTPADPMPPNYVPDVSGDLSLRTVQPGRLDELDRVYEQLEGVRRPLPRCEHVTAYSRAGAGGRLPPRFEVIPLRIEGPRYALDDAAALMRAVRAALMSVLGNAAPAALHGHGDMEHIAWLPLADVAVCQGQRGEHLLRQRSEPFLVLTGAEPAATATY